MAGYEDRYLRPLSNAQLFVLRQKVRRGFTKADLNGWEDTADDISGVLLDTWSEMCLRLPAVSPLHLQ
jgi:hypothetical protein